MFLSQLRGELRKLFARRRTYLGYVVFIVFEVLILTLWVKVGREKVAELAERNLIPMDQLYSSLTSTYWIMGGSMFLLGSIYFALVGGDIVAKESEDGNLRMVLSRPVSRLRVLLLKYFAVIIYTVTFVIFVGITGYGMSVLALGTGGGAFCMESQPLHPLGLSRMGGGFHTPLCWGLLYGPQYVRGELIGFLFLLFQNETSGGNDYGPERFLYRFRPPKHAVFARCEARLHYLPDGELGLFIARRDPLGPNRGKLRDFIRAQYLAIHCRLDGLSIP
ncbi:ABC transporter permease [bacterium]|nr:ABC transporter permease [bacterium]